jgi:hypothetical protein
MRFNKALGVVWQGENWNFEDLYWFGNVGGVFDGNVLLIYDIFRYLLWTAKLRRIFPKEQGLISNFSGIYCKQSFASNHLLKTPFLGVRAWQTFCG